MAHPQGTVQQHYDMPFVASISSPFPSLRPMVLAAPRHAASQRVEEGSHTRSRRGLEVVGINVQATARLWYDNDICCCRRYEISILYRTFTPCFYTTFLLFTLIATFVCMKYRATAMRRALLFLSPSFSDLKTMEPLRSRLFSTFLLKLLIHPYPPYHDQTLLSDVSFGLLMT